MPKTFEEKLEEKIKLVGADIAPRVTPSDVDNVIVNAEYYVFPNSQLTVCCLTLENGFTVTGESACASPENFNEEIGQTVAFKNAREKVWQLEGYLLKQYLHDIKLKGEKK